MKQPRNRNHITNIKKSLESKETRLSKMGLKVEETPSKLHAPIETSKNDVKVDALYNELYNALAAEDESKITEIQNQISKLTS